MSISIGIDFGTTYSLIASLSNIYSPIEILRSLNDELYIASHVYFGSDGNIIIGEEAKDCKSNLTIYDNKRFIGQPFNRITRFIDDYPFKIVPSSENDGIEYALEYKDRLEKKTPIDVAAIQLSYFLDIIKKRVKIGDIINFTITIPAYFTSSQKLQTQAAGYVIYVICIYKFVALMRKALNNMIYNLYN